MLADCCKASPVCKVHFWQFSQACTFAHAEKEILFGYTVPVRVPHLNRDDILQSELEAVWWQIRRPEHTETKTLPFTPFGIIVSYSTSTSNKTNQKPLSYPPWNCWKTALLKSLQHHDAVAQVAHFPKPRKAEGCKIHLIHPGKLRQECSKVCCYSGAMAVHYVFQPGQHTYLGMHIQSRMAWECLPSITPASSLVSIAGGP